MTNYVELAAQQLSGEAILDVLEFSDAVQPVSCAPLEVAVAAANAAAAATEGRLAVGAFNLWHATKIADIGIPHSTERPAGVPPTSGPIPLSGLLECRRPC